LPETGQGTTRDGGKKSGEAEFGHCVFDACLYEKVTIEGLLLHDIHSYAEPERARVQHVALDLEVDFNQRIIHGTVILRIKTAGPHINELRLDSRDQSIQSARISADGEHFEATPYKFDPPDPILGSRLSVHIQPDTQFVRLVYSTSPAASALQWLEPAQTAGGKHPFLYTQSQAIHARSWIPLQDSPGIRLTYEARVRVPEGLSAVMSASRQVEGSVSRFEMPQPIPAYLIALAVGDIAFHSLGPRTGVWAEPSVLDAAAWEFLDVEKMLEATEELYGPYRWDRYDLIVLPPSFPFGGMENPRMTFATPTILSGDRSLVSLVAHELAHSWSGNLVTNATWSDFWLNEGFTVYIERRILEKLYGSARAEMEAVIGFEELKQELSAQTPPEQILHIDLAGRDPDDGCTRIPYEKGALLLRQIERLFGRQRFDEYLRKYFDHFAFTSLTTAEAFEFLEQNLLRQSPELAAMIPFEQWIFEPGLPEAVLPHSPLLNAAEEAAVEWMNGASINTTETWSTHEWLAFLRKLPEQLTPDQMQRLDTSFHLTAVRNSEILAQWLLMVARNGYRPAFARLENFLLSVGRRKYIQPLYEALTPADAKRIYARARAGYHPITQGSVDKIPNIASAV